MLVITLRNRHATSRQFLDPYGQLCVEITSSQGVIRLEDLSPAQAAQFAQTFREAAHAPGAAPDPSALNLDHPRHLAPEPEGDPCPDCACHEGHAADCPEIADPPAGAGVHPFNRAYDYHLATGGSEPE
jgi:hypothetical protein